MKAKEVVRLFEAFEDDIEGEELTDSEMVKGVLREIDDRRVRDLWKTLDGFSSS